MINSSVVLHFMLRHSQELSKSKMLDPTPEHHLLNYSTVMAAVNVNVLI